MSKVEVTQESLADELMNGALNDFDITAIKTPEVADKAIQWLADRIDALYAEREDELCHHGNQLDTAWLGQSKQILKVANQYLHTTRNMAATMRKMARIDAANTTQQLLFQAFKAASKEKLGKTQYLEIWDAVYAANPMLRVREVFSDE